MSRENVEIVERGYALFNAGDAEVDVSLFHPDVEVRVSGVFPGFDPVYRGHSGLIRFRDTLLEAWASFEAEVREIGARGDHVVVTLMFRGKGKDSGAVVELPFHHAFGFEDGLIRRWASYPTLEHALEAVGLRE